MQKIILSAKNESRLRDEQRAIQAMQEQGDYRESKEVPLLHVEIERVPDHRQTDNHFQLVLKQYHDRER